MKDAAARWDSDLQEWSLVSTYDSTTCQACEREGDDMATWVPTDQAPPVADDEAGAVTQEPGTTGAEGKGESEGQA